MNKNFAALALLSLPVAVNGDWPTEKTVISEGHTDIRTSFEPATDEWRIEVDDASIMPAGEVIILGTPASELSVPGGSTWSFLGDEGDPVWILGSSAPQGVVDLGLNANGVAQGALSDDQVELELVNFDGPGNFFLYLVHGGQPHIEMDTRPDEGPYGSRTLSAGAHIHFNWAFTERGVYFLTLQASGTRAADGQPTESEPEVFTFLIDPLPLHWWLLENFGQAANQDIADLPADPDGDGVPNLLEYAFGLDPLSPGREGLPRLAVEEIDAESYLTISYRRPEGRTDLRYAVEAASEPGDWSELDHEELTVRTTQDPDGVERVVVRDSEPIGASTRRFMRVKIQHLGQED